MSDLRHSRGPRAQPEERLPRAAARPADRLHRPLGLGEVLARVRHHLRRGPAPLRRVALVLRPAVPRPDGQARRRLHRGPLAGDLDRPEVRLAQPALDGRHGHRGLRLPAPALRPDRAAALPELRPPRRPARRPSRSSTGSWSCPRGPGSTSSRRWCGAARGSTSALLEELARQGFARVRVDGVILELADRRAADARPLRAAHDRGRGRPPGAPRRHRAPPDRVDRDGAAPDRGTAEVLVQGDGKRPKVAVVESGTGDAEETGTAGPTTGTRCSPSPSTSPAPTAGSASRSSRRAASPSTRPTAPARPVSGSAPASRSTPSSSCPTRASPRRRCDRALGRRAERVLQRDPARPRRRSAGSRSTTPWSKLPPRTASSCSTARATKPVHVQYRNRYGRTRNYHSSTRASCPG